jgi:hypothetical protein
LVVDFVSSGLASLPVNGLGSGGAVLSRLGFSSAGVTSFAVNG